jgi:hypothetical protein
MAAKQKVKASTQEHLDIEDIVDDLVILKTGWVALVMSTTAVNFDLLSEAEQDATIYAYGAFLNSLSFPLEVLVRSKKADITAYFNSLEEAETAQPNPDMRRQIGKYKDFIQSTVQQRTVLDKKFYLVINFSPLEAGIGGLGARKPSGAKSKGELLTEAKAALAPKRDHVIKQTARLGLSTKQLTTQELVELFYDIYNPAPTGTQRVLLDTASYTTPIVEPAVEVPTPAPAGYSGSPAVGLSGESSDRQVGLPGGQAVSEPETSANQSSGLPDVASTENLRPVGPQMPQTAGVQSGASAGGPPESQSEVLKRLQEATARASSVLGGSQTQTVGSQPGSNKYQINVQGDEKRQGMGNG